METPPVADMVAKIVVLLATMLPFITAIKQGPLPPHSVRECRLFGAYAR